MSAIVALAGEGDAAGADDSAESLVPDEPRAATRDSGGSSSILAPDRVNIPDEGDDSAESPVPDQPPATTRGPGGSFSISVTEMVDIGTAEFTEKPSRFNVQTGPQQCAHDALVRFTYDALVAQELCTRSWGISQASVSRGSPACEPCNTGVASSAKRAQGSARWVIVTSRTSPSASAFEAVA